MNIKAASFCIVLLASAGLSHAASPMKDLFDDAVSTTSIGRADTAKRNGWSFGGASIRVRQMKPTLVSFRPPSINAGCSGIDFYAGSFSVINGDQLVQMMRGIAQGAATYAFGNALNSICPSCSAEIKYLQELLREFNQFASDSCAWSKELGSKLVEEPEKKEEEESVFIKSGVDAVFGVDSDFGAGLSKSDTEAVTADSSPEVLKETEYNTVWVSMRAAGMTEWGSSFSMDNHEFMEFMMSLTGTKIVSYSSSGSSDEKDVKFDNVPGTLTVEQLIEGTSDEFELLTCVENSKSNLENCLEVKETMQSGWRGLYIMYYEKIMGTAAASYKDGLAQRLYNKDQSITEAELAFLQSTGLPLSMMLEQTGYDTGTQMAIAEQAAMIMSYIHVRKMVNISILQMYQAAGGPDVPMAAKGVAVNDARNRLDSVRKELDVYGEKVDQETRRVATIASGWQQILMATKKQNRGGAL